MTQGRISAEPTPREVLECMRELLRPIPALTRRYSNQVILIALLTHAGAGLRELLASGQCSHEDVERWCRELHDLAFGKRSKVRRLDYVSTEELCTSRKDGFRRRCNNAVDRRPSLKRRARNG